MENVMRIAVQVDKEFESAAGTVDPRPEMQFSGVEFEDADRESLRQ